MTADVSMCKCTQLLHALHRVVRTSSKFPPILIILAEWWQRG